MSSMSGNFGVGIGSFMSGLMQGASVRKQWEQQDIANAREERRLKLAESVDAREAGFGERRLKLAESADARAAETNALDLKVKSADFDYTQKERAADAPLKEATRSAQLGVLKADAAVKDASAAGMAAAKADHEAARSRSIIKGVGADGKPTFMVDGKAASTEDEANRLFEQNHGTLMDRFHKIGVPKIQEAYMAAGQIDKAEAFGKVVKDAQFQKGIETAGRLEGAFQMGDWDGVTKHFKELVGNTGYMALHNYDLSAEPIKDKTGQTVGVKAKFRNKVTGEAQEAEYRDIGQLHSALMGMVNPKAAFEWNTKQIEAANAAKIEQAKGKNKLANDIELEASRSALKIAEERAKNDGPAGQKEYANGVMNILKVMSENDLLFVQKLRDGSAIAAAAAEYEKVRDRARTQSRGVIFNAPSASAPLSFGGAPRPAMAAPVRTPPPAGLYSRSDASRDNLASPSADQRGELALVRLDAMRAVIHAQSGGDATALEAAVKKVEAFNEAHPDMAIRPHNIHDLARDVATQKEVREYGIIPERKIVPRDREETFIRHTD